MSEQETVSLSHPVPRVAVLAQATLAALRAGITGSEAMRQHLAPTFGMAAASPNWLRFVNNHAWALVKLQGQGAIRKVAPGEYALAAGESPIELEPVPTPPLDGGGLVPGWASQMVANAARKNRKRWDRQPFTIDELRELWRCCGGRCSLTGLPFLETQVGSGRARRPYAPSLDRIDPERPYTLENCRLVRQSVNFALAVAARRRAEQPRR